MRYEIRTYIHHTVILRNGEVFAIIPRNAFVAMGAVLGVIYDTETPPF